MKLIAKALTLGAALFMVGCQTMTPEQKAQMEADARLCAKNGMLVEEMFGYYSCHRMPSDHELQRYLMVGERLHSKRRVLSSQTKSVGLLAHRLIQRLIAFKTIAHHANSRAYKLPHNIPR